MYNYKTQNQLAREKRHDQILFFSIGLVCGFSLACFLIYINL